MNPGIIDEIVLVNARRFAEKCISDKLKNLTPNEFYILQISKFILLKEKLIKKDRNSNLHFNYEYHHEYVPVIKEIGDALIKNATILKVKNVLNVIIEPREYNKDDELKYYIYLIHKIRDILAHGSYHVDFKNRQIIIYNDTSELELFTSIPLDLIEKFTYIEKPIRLRRPTYYSNQFSDKINTYINSYSNINDLYYISKKELYGYNDPIYSRELYDYDAPIYYNSYAREKREQLEVLRMLISYANQMGLPHKSLDEIAELFKKYNMEKELDISTPFIFTVKSLVDEISKIIGVKSKNANPYAFVATYNYLQIYLSNKYSELWNNRPEALSYLRLSKINPMYGVDSNLIKSLNDMVRTIVRRTKKSINKYNFVDNIVYKEKILADINKSFKNGISGILSQLGNHNMEVITHIRNGIDHGNIVDSDGQILLYDKDDQNDDKSGNFVCFGSSKDFFDIIETLDLNILTPFTNEELIKELEGIIEESLLEEFRLLMEEIDKLNKEIKK